LSTVDASGVEIVEDTPRMPSAGPREVIEISSSEGDDEVQAVVARQTARKKKDPPRQPVGIRLDDEDLGPDGPIPEFSNEFLDSLHMSDLDQAIADLKKLGLNNGFKLSIKDGKSKDSFPMYCGNKWRHAGRPNPADGAEEQKPKVAGKGKQNSERKGNKGCSFFFGVKKRVEVGATRWFIGSIRCLEHTL
jgi:hypothetical protein